VAHANDADRGQEVEEEEIRQDVAVELPHAGRHPHRIDHDEGRHDDNMTPGSPLIVCPAKYRPKGCGVAANFRHSPTVEWIVPMRSTQSAGQTASVVTRLAPITNPAVLAAQTVAAFPVRVARRYREIAPSTITSRM